jgi:2-methylcitrate dehydratase
MKNLSRREFGKAMIATASVAGLAAGYSGPTQGRIGSGNSPSPATDPQSGTDSVLAQIADYVDRFDIKSQEAYSTSRLSLLDSLACGFEALTFPACTKMLGPVVPGTRVPNGARVPGTELELDPVLAAFNIGLLERWMDYSDETPMGAGPDASHGGHPSDNVGGVLATADYLSRVRVAQGKAPLVMRDVLTSMIKAYEIQGVLGLDKSAVHFGLDNVWLAKVATAAVVTKMLGGNREEIVNAASQAFVDVASLRLYRDEPTWGTRKSWAGGDATSRGVWLALITLKGEMGYPTALTAKTRGVYDALFNGHPFKLQRPYGSYIAETVLFKVSFPVEYGIQSAVECAFKLHPLVKDRLNDIEKITLNTHGDMWTRMGVRQPQPLTNPAARDHSLQYATAVALIFGTLKGTDYEDRVAADPRIDALRTKMIVIRDKQYAEDYVDPEKLSRANAIQIQFKDGTSTEKVEIQYPLGHHRRRAEAIPLLMDKFKNSLALRFPVKQQEKILSMCQRQETLEATPVNEFMEAFMI